MQRTRLPGWGAPDQAFLGTSRGVSTWACMASKQGPGLCIRGKRPSGQPRAGVGVPACTPKPRSPGEPPEHQPWQPWHPGQRRTGLCAPSPRAGWSARPAASRPGWAARCRRRKPSARPPWPGTRRSTVQGAACTEHWTLSTAEPRTAVTAAAAGLNAGNTALSPASSAGGSEHVISFSQWEACVLEAPPLRQGVTQRV